MFRGVEREKAMALLIVIYHNPPYLIKSKQNRYLSKHISDFFLIHNRKLYQSSFTLRH